MIKKILSFGIATIGLLVAWHVCSIVIDKPFLPTPFASVSALTTLFVEGTITAHVLASAYRVASSLLFATVFAVPLGLFLGRTPIADRFFAPFLYILYPIPKVVFLPIIVLLLGLGDSPKIFLITLVVFFQILMVARDAAKSIPQASIDSMRSLSASNLQIYMHLILPYALPQILTSLRITVGTAISILFFAETFASVNGIGYFILDTMTRRAYDMMYGAIICMGLLGLIAYLIVDVLEHILCGWKKL